MGIPPTLKINCKMNSSMHRVDINSRHDNYKMVPLYVWLHCLENKQDCGQFWTSDITSALFFSFSSEGRLVMHNNTIPLTTYHFTSKFLYLFNLVHVLMGIYREPRDDKHPLNEVSQVMLFSITPTILVSILFWTAIPTPCTIFIYICINYRIITNGWIKHQN